MKWFLCFAFALISLGTGFAQEITEVFVAPTGPVVAGNQCSVWLYCMNNWTNEARQYFAPRVDAQFLPPSGPLHTVLTLNAAAGKSVAVAPGAFVKQEYFLDVPSTIRGQVALSITNANQIMLQVTAPTITVAPPETNAPPVVITAQTNMPKRSILAKFFDNHISPYEPIYFLVGTYPAAEFQFSLKYQLFDLTNGYHVLTNLYFAYTQTSYWDLISSDPSFFDSSYKPSVFAYYPDLVVTRNKFVQLDLQGGAEHESNGQGGTRERSIYSAYLQPTLTFGRPGHLQFALRPRAWTYFLVGHNNPDIAQYRGYADLHAFLTLKKEPNSWENFQVESRFRVGDTGEHPSIQIDARYKFPHFNPTLDVQYFDGYGQTLRQYNKKAHGLRFGLCLWYWPDYPPHR